MPAKEDNIFVRLSNNYSQFTASEKKLVDYILSHKSNVQYLSISELAAECKIGDATISRFCRRLGLKGYSDFKLAAAKSIEGREVKSTPEYGFELSVDTESAMAAMLRKLYIDHTQAIVQTMTFVRSKDINAAMDILMNAKKVYCMGQGGSIFLAMEAAYILSSAIPKFFSFFDSHIQASMAATMKKNDALLLFSYSGSTKDNIELINTAHAVGAKVILVTRYMLSPGAAISDVVLQCGSDESPLQLGSVEAKMAQLFLVDLLFKELCMRTQKQSSENRERIAEAIAQKHL